MDGRDGALVEAACRLRGDQDAWALREDCGRGSSFCMLPPERSRVRCLRTAAAHIEFLDDLAGEGHAGLAVDQSTAAKSAAKWRSSTAFSQIAISPIAPSLLRSSGMRPMPACNQALDAEFGDRLCQTARDRRRCAQPVSPLTSMAERRLAIAGDADDAEHFAVAQLQVDFLQPLDCRRS